MYCRISPTQVVRYVSSQPKYTFTLTFAQYFYWLQIVYPSKILNYFLIRKLKRK